MKSRCEVPGCGWAVTCEWLCRRGLTPQESRTAVLLAQQRTNKEIARSLGRSVRTAEHHVEAVLAKLWIKRRQVSSLVTGSAGMTPVSGPACMRALPGRGSDTRVTRSQKVTHSWRRRSQKQFAVGATAAPPRPLADCEARWWRTHGARLQ